MSTKRKLTNRGLAEMYLAKAKEEDEKKINAFSKAAFTDVMLVKMGGYSTQEFKEAGKLPSKDLGKYLSEARENLDAAKSKKEKSDDLSKNETAKSKKQDSVKAYDPQMQVSSPALQVNTQMAGAPQGQMVQQPNINYGKMPQ